MSKKNGNMNLFKLEKLYSVVFRNAKFDVRQRFIFVLKRKGFTSLKTVSFTKSLN